ncbi:hypothetical protein ACFWMR_30675 [Amycolatopsis thailandensis]|uniref:hypothetical protein n=1 Tax=Amycolatopsis thailandensis TaxID=589330 RepID=UPI003663F11F
MTVTVVISALAGIGVIAGRTTRAAVLVVLSCLALRGTTPNERKAILRELAPLFASGMGSRRTPRRLTARDSSQSD